MVRYLQDLWRSDGPFDGIMGYSQGAAVAGGLSAEMMLGQFPEFRFAIIICHLDVGGNNGYKFYI